jgi:hypothetical protein
MPDISNYDYISYIINCINILLDIGHEGWEYSSTSVDYYMNQIAPLTPLPRSSANYSKYPNSFIIKNKNIKSEMEYILKLLICEIAYYRNVDIVDIVLKFTAGNKEIKAEDVLDNIYNCLIDMGAYLKKMIVVYKEYLVAKYPIEKKTKYFNTIAELFIDLKKKNTNSYYKFMGVNMVNTLSSLHTFYILKQNDTQMQFLIMLMKKIHNLMERGSSNWTGQKGLKGWNIFKRNVDKKDLLKYLFYIHGYILGRFIGNNNYLKGKDLLLQNTTISNKNKGNKLFNEKK